MAYRKKYVVNGHSGLHSESALLALLALVRHSIFIVH